MTTTDDHELWLGRCAAASEDPAVRGPLAVLVVSDVALDVVRGVADGDVAVAGRLRALPWDEVVAAASLARPVVTATSVARVLRGLAAGHIEAATAQEWASLVRWGLLPDASLPAVSVDLEWETTSEEEIADAVARLEELGDAIDGEISAAEAARLVERLENAAAIE